MLKRLRPGVTNLNDQIAIDRREVYASFKNLRIYRDYAMGRQDSTLTVAQQQMLEGVLGNEFSDNHCGMVIEEHSNRLELKRITAKQDTSKDADDSSLDPDGDGDTDPPAKVKGQSEQEWIDDFWQRMKFDDLQARVHRNTIRDGNYCLMVDYNQDKKKIVIHREPWWDGYIGVFIGYDAYGDILYAVKEWDTVDGKRRTIYYEGAIERYIAQGGGSVWIPFALPGDGQPTTGAIRGTEAIPLEFNDANGLPMHVPFIHFTNPSHEFENYGSSILEGGKIGAQDMINDIRYDIASAARMNGYQRTWSKGYKLQKINGKTVKPRTGPGVHYHADEDSAAWGVLEPGSTENLINVYKMNVEAFCRNTSTPYASITGNWPSGEALYRQEKPIYGATKQRQKRLMPQWVEVIHRCIELANTYDHEGLDEDILLTAEYSDAGDRDPLSLAMADLSLWQAAEAAVQAGMPLETFLKVQGWGDDQMTGLSTDIVNQIKARRADLEATNPDNPNGGTNVPVNRGSARKPTATNRTGGKLSVKTTGKQLAKAA